MRLQVISVADKSKQAGLTVLELMIASSVFAVILLVIAVGVLSFSNDYYKGITSSKTQGTARLAMAQLTQAIQFSKQLYFVSGTPACISTENQAFVFGLDKQVSTSPAAGNHQGNHALIAVPGTSCSGGIPGPASTAIGGLGGVGSPATLPTGYQELLGQHMRLAILQVTNVPGAGKVYAVHIKIVYGDDDLLTSAVSSTMTCVGGMAGFQFCGVSDLSTTIGQRLL